MEGNYLSIHYTKKVYAHQKSLLKEIMGQYNKIPDIEYSLYPTAKKPELENKEGEGTKQKWYHFFLDIDHTLTDNSKGEIDNRCSRAFKEMKKLGHTIHFATGRDHKDVQKNIVIFTVSDRAIAENGGIILGINIEPFLYGNIDCPRQALDILQEKFEDIEVDGNQSERLTEVVIKKNHDVKEIKKIVGEVATVLVSKRAIHLTEPGVDKGTSMMHLVNKSPDIEDDKIVAIGDSQLDAPMLIRAHMGFALKNSDEYAMEAADIVLTGGKFFDGVLIAFKKMDKRFNLNSYKLRYADSSFF